MLASILHILAVIGMILGLILFLLLLMLLLILFIPVRYRFFFEKEDGWEASNISLQLKATWLFHLLQFTFSINPNKSEIKLLGFSLRSQKKKKTTSKTSDKKKSELLSNKDTNPNTAPKSNPTLKDSVSDSDTIKSKQEENKSVKRDTKSGLYDKIKQIKDFLTSEEFSEGYMFLKSKIDSFLKQILPKKISGTIQFGFSEPDKTGMVLGTLSMIKGIGSFQSFEFIPDFEKEILCASLKGSGRLYIFILLKIAVSVYTNQNLRRLIKKIR